MEYTKKYTVYERRIPRGPWSQVCLRACPSIQEYTVSSPRALDEGARTRKVYHSIQQYTAVYNTVYRNILQYTVYVHMHALSQCDMVFAVVL